MTARNVKIITTNGMVTLRGPVNSNAEKTEIGMAAQNIAGQNAVDNQLEVKSSQ
jgi:osmotically-inducible protein OsmY